MAQIYPPKYNNLVQYTTLDDLKESSIELSLVHCGKEQCRSSHVVQDVRDEFILHFVLSGKGIYTTGNKSWTLTSNKMFLIYPNTNITYIADATEPWEYAWIGFKGFLSEKLLYRCGFSEQNLVSDISDVQKIFSFVDDILAHRQLTYSNELYRKGVLMQIFSHLVKNSHDSKTKASGVSYDYSANIYVNHAIEFISKFYNDDINVVAIADYIGISRTHLNNLFQKELGTTVQKFIIDIRLHKAANLLVSTTDSISEIANFVGYSDALAFSKMFKKNFHKSPKFYRNEKQLLDHHDEVQL